MEVGLVVEDTRKRLLLDPLDLPPLLDLVVLVALGEEGFEALSMIVVVVDSEAEGSEVIEEDLVQEAGSATKVVEASVVAVVEEVGTVVELLLRMRHQGQEVEDVLLLEGLADLVHLLLVA